MFPSLRIHAATAVRRRFYFWRVKHFRKASRSIRIRLLQVFILFSPQRFKMPHPLRRRARQAGAVRPRLLQARRGREGAVAGARSLARARARDTDIDIRHCINYVIILMTLIQ